ncbi:MAG: fumarylacetoacetate hydrolase family protein [Burkholderiales bacterium]|nr:fumarylacetoacetate hydrolase family protein [Burkholderiales bacterium]
MDATAIAAELAALNENGGLAPPFSRRDPPLAPACAAAAARRLHERRLAAGWRPRGRKIGFTNRTLWPRYGVFEPIWGFVYDRTLIEAAQNRAVVPLAGLAQPRIEPEIAFGLKRAPAAADPHSLVAAIDWVAHAVEIVQCHHPGWAVALADAIADNGLHGRLVLGAPMPAHALGDLAASLPSASVELRRDEALVERGRGENVLGSPLAALGWLVEALARDPQAPPLAAGDVVSTGTLTDAHPVAAGERWRTRFDGIALPGLEIAFA